MCPPTCWGCADKAFDALTQPLGKYGDTALAASATTKLVAAPCPSCSRDLPGKMTLPGVYF